MSALIYKCASFVITKYEGFERYGNYLSTHSYILIRNKKG